MSRRRQSRTPTRSSLRRRRSENGLNPGALELADLRWVRVFFCRRHTRANIEIGRPKLIFRRFPFDRLKDLADLGTVATGGANFFASRILHGFAFVVEASPCSDKVDRVTDTRLRFDLHAQPV